MARRTMSDALYDAQTAAGSGPGWNLRFLQALDANGLRMTKHPPAGQAYIMAPIPMEGDPHAWNMPQYLSEGW